MYPLFLMLALTLWERLVVLFSKCRQKCEILIHVLAGSLDYNHHTTLVCHVLQA